MGMRWPVTRVFAGFAVNDPRAGGANEKVTLPVLGGFANDGLHWRGELIETDCVLQKVASIRRRKRLVIGEEIIRPSKISFSFFIVARVNSIIRPLEESALSVLDEFE